MTDIDDTIEIVIPCYNPLANWHTNLIHSFQKFEESAGHKCVLILVNDGSTKGVTIEHIEKISAEVENFRYVKYSENKGKGYALRKGIAETTGSNILLTDVDFPYTNSSMIKILESLRKGYDLTLGYREASYYRKVPFMRLLISKTFRIMLKALMQMNINDTQCGLKGLNKTGKKIFLRTKTNGYLYDLEFVKKAGENNLKIDRAVVELKDGVEFTNMRLSVLWKEARNFARILLS